MTPLDLALKYLDAVFLSGDVDALRPLLADDLEFQGPWFQYDSAEAYLNALRADPPEGFSFELLQTFADETSACLIYRFTKPGVSTLMAQTFRIENGRIKRIRLIFDTGAFQKTNS